MEYPPQAVVILPPLCKGRDAAAQSAVKTVHRRLFLAKAAKQLCCELGVVLSSSVSETKNGRIILTQLLFVQLRYNPPPDLRREPPLHKGALICPLAELRTKNIFIYNKKNALRITQGRTNRLNQRF